MLDVSSTLLLLNDIPHSTNQCLARHSYHFSGGVEEVKD